MKYLRSFNESYKEPLDVESDINDFYLKFFGSVDKLPLNDNRWSNFKEEADALISDNPTMTDEWEVYGVYSGPNLPNKAMIAYVRAISPLHAKVRLALSKNNKDCATSWYGAELFSKDDIDGKIDELEHEINLLKNPI